MCMTRTVNIPSTTLITDVTSDVNANGLFIFVTGWMDPASVQRLRFTFEVSSFTGGSGVIKPGIQYANSESSPDTALTLSGAVAQTGNGFAFPTELSDVVSTSAGKQLVRLGFWFLASTSGLKTARVCGKAEIQS